MIIYTVISRVKTSRAEQWIDYFKQKHLQDLLDTGCFQACEFAELQDPGHGIREFEAKYYADGQSNLDQYLKNHAAKLRDEVVQKFGEDFSSTRRILQILDSKKI